MNNFQADLVLPFHHSLKEQVERFVGQHPYSQLLSLQMDGEFICVVVNKTTTNNLKDWLNELIKIIDYDTHKDFYELSEGNILHLYLSAQSRADEFDLKLSAKHLLLFWQLGIVLDVDYGIGFDHTI